MDIFEWENGTVVERPYVEIDGIKHYVQDGTISGGTPVSSTNLISMQNILNQNMLDIYSTEEIITNKIWIDNKPIYRKCIFISSFPNNAELQIDITSLNLEYLVHLYGFAGTGGAGDNGFPINASRPDNLSAEAGAWLNNTNNIVKLIIRTGSDRSNFAGYVVLEYTKTTD